MYDWREMTDEERRLVLKDRVEMGNPWHSPAHLDLEGEHVYLVSAACYEHKAIIGERDGRMADCAGSILTLCNENCIEVYAWCVLPNHYHVLLRTEGLNRVRGALGDYHGRSSRWWNLEDHKVGRKVWHNHSERSMKSDRHFYATLNYVHHNPVKHGYVTGWEEWPYGSAREYLEAVGKERAAEIWSEYPVLDYGEKWDI